ncbi:MFS transporter [Amycolatopsis rubida]|uniref:MFS transporter n=1 Tax=Amycolatopsis rubida TaxID=112413 RepID=A0ABX0BKJ6_9PSEU|nr:MULTISPECIES: MFS transporter [Amycolatopsis]MYW91089.1 MFS transporter [Amycolatopsis rubida]NEC56074.1 MFS transporter [Amycolatopsis rubida]OAP23134.1 Purine efflux pump PbuE [Amycolatopsis sp. M39]
MSSVSSSAAARNSVLAFGAFGVGTSGYIVAGLLPALTSELHISATAAAQLVTSFAIAYAVGSPLFAAATGRWERRTLLVAALAVAAVGNVFAAVAPGYTTLLIARVVTAIGAAVYTPAATAVAAELTTPERRGRAVSLVFGGLTIALIFGVPLGSVISQQFGYEGAFLFVGILSLLGAIGVRVALPKVAPPPVVGLAERFAVARDKRVLALLVTTTLACLAAFMVYTLVSPVLSATAGVSGGTITVLLFCYGIGGAIGNFAGGRAADRWGARKPLLIVLIGFTAVMVLLPFTATTVVGAGITLFVWGLANWSFSPPLQHRLIELSPGHAGLALSLNASAIYLGVGLSGVVGGAVLTSAGPTVLPEIAAILAAAAMLVVVFFWGARKRAEVREEVAV